MPQAKCKKCVPGSCLESVFQWYHLFPCDQYIPTNPLSIPTYPSPLNASSHTPAQTLLLLIPPWHSLKHLCPSTVSKQFWRCLNSSLHCGQAMAEELAKRWAGWDRPILGYSNTWPLCSHLNYFSFRPALCQPCTFLIEQMLVLCCFFHIFSTLSILKLTPSTTNKIWQDSVHGRQM